MSRQQVRNFDSRAINELGIPGVVLMENAGRGCAEFIIEQIKNLSARKVCIFCGTGNNGGDGYVIARHLHNRRVDVMVIICGNKEKIRGDAKINLDIIEKMALPMKILPVAETADKSDGVQGVQVNKQDLSKRVHDLAGTADIIVDGIFGTGLRGQLKAPYDLLIEAINQLGKPVIAVDIPSGLDCDTGLPLPVAIRAEHTVTFAANKKGFVVSQEARQYTGQVHVCSIGIEPFSLPSD